MILQYFGNNLYSVNVLYFLCIMSSNELSFAVQINSFIASSFHAHFFYHLFDASTQSSELTINNLILFNLKTRASYFSLSMPHYLLNRSYT